MTAFDWIALVGAAAWLPQIAAAIYRLVVKPRVRFIPVPEIEVGYNFLGPILNLKAALFAERKDAIVVDMSVTLTHERGRAVPLSWHSFVEKFSEVRSQIGEKAEVSRDQEATVLRLTTILPTEKFIRFQDPTFQEESRKLTALADAELNRLKAGMDDPALPFLTSKAYSDLASFYRHHFCWEAGKYNFELRLQLLERKSQAIARTSFVLSERDVEALRNNIALVETRMGQIARGVPNEELTVPNNWAAPRLASKNVMVKA